MNPLKQGLKPYYFGYDIIGHGSLSMNPLKQGLKPEVPLGVIERWQVFIHESIKTRVETEPGTSSRQC